MPRRRAAGGAEGKRPNGALESEVLGVLWAADRPLTPAEVQQTLDASGGRDLAYTTVATTLTRLLAKQQLTREPAGRGHVYAPTRDAAQFAAERMRGVLDSVVGAGADQSVVLQHFIAGLDPDDDVSARRLIAQLQELAAEAAPVRTTRARRPRR